MASSGSGTFKAIMQPGRSVSQKLSLSGLVSLVHRAGSSLTLRELVGTSGFANSVCCQPASITIIRYRDGDKAGSFRQALLQQKENQSISIRYGAKPLHPSEVFIVGTSRYIWKEPTVADVLRVAGASAQDLSNIITAIDVDEKTSPTSLTDAEMRRLTMCCSFFAPAPVILFDKPFNPLNDHWCDVMGEMMLDAVKRTKKIFVVTDLDRLPASWAANNRVFRASFQDDLEEEEGSSKNARLLKNARAMLRTNRDLEADKEYFITRPQTIHDKPPRPKVFESLHHSESIRNPKFDSGDSKPAVKALNEKTEESTTESSSENNFFSKLTSLFTRLK